MPQLRVKRELEECCDLSLPPLEGDAVRCMMLSRNTRAKKIDCL
jgi:hypothetical protein